MGSNASKASALIESGSDTSNVVSAGNMTVVGVEFPATFTGASVSFTTSNKKDGAFIPLSGVTVTKTTGSGIVSIDPSTVYSLLSYVKVVSASTEAQDSAVNIILRNLA